MSDDLQSRLEQKLDMFMQYYKDRHIELERRVSRNEEDIEDIKNEIKGLHNSSMQLLNDLVRQLTDKFNTSIQEVERRITDRIEANAKSSSYNWITIASIIVSAFIGVGSMIVAIVALFFR